MFRYLHNGTYHTDISAEYMSRLGLDKDTQDAILIQKHFEETQEPSYITSFKANRKALIDGARVTISTGKVFDANEQSIIRLGNAVIKNMSQPDDTIIPWSTADVGTGIMVECTKTEIIEAHQLATDNFAAMWAIEE